MPVTVNGGSAIDTLSLLPVGSMRRGLLRNQNNSPAGRPVRSRARVASPSPRSSAKRRYSPRRRTPARCRGAHRCSRAPATPRGRAHQDVRRLLERNVARHQRGVRHRRERGKPEDDADDAGHRGHGIQRAVAPGGCHHFRRRCLAGRQRRRERIAARQRRGDAERGRRAIRRIALETPQDARGRSPDPDRARSATAAPRRPRACAPVRATFFASIARCPVNSSYSTSPSA